MIGKTLAHYEILKKIGAGGMGEVYRARDPQLDREVAIKILPGSATGDPDNLARFKQEAKTLAAVNHPGIATVFGLHEQGGTRFMAMELVPGSDLSQRISKGALPTREAIKFALQIAEALEAAHEQGIIHRDLKPQNLMVAPDGKIKILDFGLARVLNRRPISSDDDPSPTITVALTQPGTVMGTPAYMSPEQVQGEAVDARNDIWAFGAVLYEMLTGKKAFGGKNVSEIMYQVLATDPDLGLLPASLPSGVRRLVRRCLVKEARNRLQSIGDARVILQEAIEGKLIPGEAATPSTKSKRGLALWLLLPLAVVAAWFLKPQETTVPEPSLRVEVPLPGGEWLDAYHRRGLTLSPDGKTLAFVSGPNPDRWRFSFDTRIYLRPLDQWQARAIPGTENGLQPFFSPDGQWLGFIRDGKLWKVNISGGEPLAICECKASFGASWGPDGTIVFAGLAGGLQQVSSTGGEPVALTELDKEAGEKSHRLPRILPDGKTVLFTVLRYRLVSLDWSLAQVFIQSLETGERKLVINGGADAHYLPSGHLVFARDDRLMAVRFDLKRWETEGSEVVVLEHVGRSINTGHAVRETGLAQFSVSDSGALAYASGTTFLEEKLVVVWVDREGREEILKVEPKNYLSARVSPDGLKVLLTVSYPPRDVWLYDLGRQILRRQTFVGNQGFAIWGPGPDQFTFSSDREGGDALFVKAINTGPGEVERLPFRMEGYYPPGSWSSDGKTLAFLAISEGNPSDIFTFETDGSVKPFLNSRFGEAFPEFSPDGRWLVYTSNESGSQEVFVCPYPGPGRAIQISKGGGTSPAWSRDGLEIFFRGYPDRQYFFSVEVKLDDGRLTPGEPVALNLGAYDTAFGLRRHDVAPDGRLLLIREDREATPIVQDEVFPTNIKFVQGWFSELQEMCPPEK